MAECIDGEYVFSPLKQPKWISALITMPLIIPALPHFAGPMNGFEDIFGSLYVLAVVAVGFLWVHGKRKTSLKVLAYSSAAYLLFNIAIQAAGEVY